MKRALTIAGSDPSGGAGIQADLKTFHQFGVYGQSAITLLTVQNTLGVSAVSLLDPAFVREQIVATRDVGVDAFKTGALGSSAIIDAILEVVPDAPFVLDPVMISKHGASLLADVDAIKRLVPRATLLTPNVPEAEALLGHSIADFEAAAAELLALGPRAVLLKGGHRECDDLFFDGDALWLRAERVDTPHTHGTGCTLAAAITALLANDVPLREAVQRAKRFITNAIKHAPRLGAGQGPVNHFALDGEK